MYHEYYYYNKEELLRCPRIPLIVREKNEDVFRALAMEMVTEIKRKNALGEHTVFICPVGPIGQYPYFVEMVGVSYGLQIGVQSTALVLVVATEEGIKTLQEGRITLGGNISMAAGPVGRSAEAGTDIQLKASMYSYSISRGVFAGASLEGSSINNNESANKLYWGEELTPSQMLSKEAKGESIQVLLNTLASITE